MTKRIQIGLDLDGTLIDTAARHKAALIQAAHSAGVELAVGFPEIYYEEKREGTPGRQVLLRYSIPQTEQILREWLKNIEQPSLLRLDCLFPSVLDTLEEMAQNCEFFVVTARQREAAVREQVRSLGLNSYLTEVLVARLSPVGNVARDKHELTTHLKLQAIVGDSEADQNWANQLGVQFFGVSSGIRNKAFWSKRSVTPFDTFRAALERVATRFLNKQISRVSL
jgi:phosphoglycolate phosphatase-like HAD superfamily hydrolase